MHYITKGGAHPVDKQTDMTLRKNFPCHKQPANSGYYRYYMCKHMQVQGRYTIDPERVRDYSLLRIDRCICVIDSI
jgi:hypothetical protein